jgi:hypothetical protein
MDKGDGVARKRAISMSRKWAIVMLGLPVLLMIGIAALAIADHALYSPRQFDAERWRSGDPLQRMRMARELNQSALVGKKWDEVLELLGPADREDPGWLLEYELVQGDVISFLEWRERMCVWFDRETGRVTGVTFFD